MSDHAWCRDIPRDLAVRATEDGRDGPLPALEQAIDAVWMHTPKTAPAANAGGGSNHGLRTERVTLEVTHDLDAPLGRWLVGVIDESLGLLESVRVVEECCLDRINMGEVIRERDAAIREREEAKRRADRDSVKCSALADNVITLRARVAELEAAPAASGAAATGWLDEVEREALEAARDYFDNDDHGDSECVFIARVLKQILARLSPPGPEGDG